jgi:small subunit ribosomal protein S10e
VTPKDTKLSNHPQIPVPQLHVVKLLQSLRSKNVVKEKFNWQYLYYVLTDEGIEYLRNYLHISEETVPATLKKPSKPQPPSTITRSYGDESGRGRGRGGARGGRGGYRGPKTEGAPSGFNPEFQGASRGRGGMSSRGGRGGAVAAE